MRIVVAPDKFAGTLTAIEAAEAVREGWLQTAPGDELELVPLSDGGPGFLDVLQSDLGGTVHATTVTGPLGVPTPAPLLQVDDTVYIEAAQACGLHLVDPGQRDPLASSSYGVGELIALALEAGVRRIVVGVGGTASVDGGAGLLAALGAGPRDQLSRGGGALGELAGEVDLTTARRRLEGVELVAATDVDAPLLGSEGAAHGFGAQKGADRAGRDQLETALRVWATATDGGVAVRGGAGAGGGIGFALLLLGATREPGAQLALDAVRLEERARQADLLITGEGAFDWQSLRGKVVAGVARTGQHTGRPTVVLAGRVEVGRRELSNAGIDSAYAIVDMPARERGHTANEDLRALAARVARTWSR
ncbi:MAG: glycerate 2-kinase [Actinomycetota bacterium]|nr:glycerate 2-kinase [Actinomycetota bacterium]